MSSGSKVGVIFMGPPGSGKGTQLSYLEESLKDSCGFIIMSNLLKSSVSDRSKVDGFLKHGKLVPDDVVNSTFRGELERMSKSGVKIFCFDGFPRTQNQAIFLDDFVEVKLVLLFVISDKEIISRLSSRLVCGTCNSTFSFGEQCVVVGSSCSKCCQGVLMRRIDDDAEIVLGRISLYRKVEGELLDFYQEKVVEINVEADISYVRSRVRCALGAIGVDL